MPKPWRKFLNDSDDYVLGHIYALEANSVNDLFAEYERAYHRMAIGLEALQRQYGEGDTWNATDAFYRVRTEKLLAQIAQEMQGLSNASQDMVLQNAMQSYYAGYLGRAWVSETLAGQDLTMALLPTTAVRAAILKPYEGSTFVDRFKANEEEFQARIRKSIVQSQIEGETIYQAQKRIANELGLNIDRRRKADKQANQGHFNRTQMIARTEILRTSNLGAVAFYQQNDDVLKGWEWRATQDARTCPVCGNLDGKVFSFKDRQNPPPAHPSCLLPGTIVCAPEKIVGATKSFYVGPCVEITLADGRKLAITENHPILTPGGWFMASALREGDNVIGTISREGMLFPVHPDNDYRPAIIEEIFSSLMKNGEMIARRMPATAEDFHGDGKYTQGDIDIINVNSLLLDKVRIINTQPISQNILSAGNVTGAEFNTFGPSNFFLDGHYAIASRRMGGSKHFASHFRGGVFPPDIHLIRNISALDTVALQEFLDYGTTDTEGLADFLFAHARDVSVQPVIGIRHFDFSGHVYNLEIDVYGLYISNGIVTGNCRCSATPAFLSDKVNDFVKVRSFKEWVASKNIQTNIYGQAYTLKPQKPPKSPGVK